MKFVRNYIVPTLIGAGIALIIMGLTGCSVNGGYPDTQTTRCVVVENE